MQLEPHVKAITDPTQVEKGEDGTIITPRVLYCTQAPTNELVERWLRPLWRNRWLLATTCVKRNRSYDSTALVISICAPYHPTQLILIAHTTMPRCHAGWPCESSQLL